MISFSRKWNALQNYWTRTCTHLSFSSQIFYINSDIMQRLTYKEKNRDELLQYNAINLTSQKKWLELPLNRKTLLRICFNTMWFLRYLSSVFLVRKKNPCYFCHFCDIWGHFGALSSLSKSWFFLDLLLLRFLLYLSPVFSASKKNPCYFCDFCDICGHFGVLLVSFFSKSWFLLDLLIAIFAICVSDFLT